MGENSKIEWTTHTFNPWTGCTRVSKGCQNCYAEEMMDHRWHKVQWGPKGERIRTSPDNWKKPIQWNRQCFKCTVCATPNPDSKVLVIDSALRNGHIFPCQVNGCPGEYVRYRQRVFCASLADVFEDRPELAPWRVDLFDLIRKTPNLDWLLLTKRPENIKSSIGQAFVRLTDEPMRSDLGNWLGDWFQGLPPRNVWLGTSVEDQEAANKRVIELLNVPAAIRFISVEPLLGPVDITRIHISASGGLEHIWFNCLSSKRFDPWSDGDLEGFPNINWIIAGAESGPHARPMELDWVRSLRDQCVASGTPFFFKQDAVKGKKVSLPLLDGHTWDQFPEVR